MLFDISLLFQKKIYDFWLNFELFRSYFSYVGLVPLDPNEYDDGDDNVNDNGLFTFYGIFRPAAAIICEHPLKERSRRRRPIFPR